MFAHESLDVYRVSLEFVAWAFRLCAALPPGERHTRDQIHRASQSLPLNIAEGNGKPPGADRRRFQSIALGSTLECAAILDVLHARGAIDEATVVCGKELLNRVTAMLTRLTGLADCEVSHGQDSSP